MSSRIIRGAERVKRTRISSAMEHSGGMPQDHVMTVEKQAFEKGYHEGERMGKQMGEQMLATVVKRYEQSLAEIGIAHRRLVESMERESVKLALEIARTILRREVSTDPDVVTALAAVATRQVAGQDSVVLRVSPDDYDRVRQAFQEVDSSVKVEQASSLERGDFLIDTGKTHLDGRISARIGEIGRALLEGGAE